MEVMKAAIDARFESLLWDFKNLNFELERLSQIAYAWETREEKNKIYLYIWLYLLFLNTFTIDHEELTYLLHMKWYKGIQTVFMMEIVCTIWIGFCFSDSSSSYYLFVDVD